MSSLSGHSSSRPEKRRRLESNSPLALSTSDTPAAEPRAAGYPAWIPPPFYNMVVESSDGVRFKVRKDRLIGAHKDGSPATLPDTFTTDDENLPVHPFAVPSIILHRILGRIVYGSDYSIPPASFETLDGTISAAVTLALPEVDRVAKKELDFLLRSGSVDIHCLLALCFRHHWDEGAAICASATTSPCCPRSTYSQLHDTSKPIHITLTEAARVIEYEERSSTALANVIVTTPLFTDQPLQKPTFMCLVDDTAAWFTCTHSDKPNRLDDFTYIRIHGGALCLAPKWLVLFLLKLQSKLKEFPHRSTVRKSWSTFLSRATSLCHTCRVQILEDMEKLLEHIIKLVQAALAPVGAYSFRAVRRLICYQTTGQIQATALP